jgi:hypothetical protein
MAQQGQCLTTCCLGRSRGFVRPPGVAKQPQRSCWRDLPPPAQLLPTGTPRPAGHHDEDPPRRRPRRRRQGPVPVLGGLPEPDQHAVLHRRPWAGYVPRRAADALQWQLRDHVSGARRRPPRRATPSAMRARFPIRSRLGSLLRAAHGSRWGLALWVARKSSPSALTAATAHAPRATSARDAYPWLAVGPTRDGAQDFYDNCDTTGLPPSMDTLATTCRSTVRPSSFLAV